MALRFFEDFTAGEVIELGSYAVTEEGIIAFAKEWDPQYFHTDPERAKKSSFGGLAASGWHTCSIYMRLMVDGLLKDTASIVSPGVDEIRWLRPVRPGDVLSGRSTIVESIPSRSRADRGTLKQRCELSNQKGETVMTLRVASVVGRRPSDAAG